jgi:hypothetical protein
VTPQNTDFLQSNFCPLYLEERAKYKALIICFVYTTMASGQETNRVITGQLAEVHHCSGRMPVRLRHLKAAHWKWRGLQHTKLFSASEKEVSKQMLKNYQNTTKHKYFQIKGDVCFFGECL